MAAGYSKRTLAEKLGIRQDSNIVIINSPEYYIKELGKSLKEVTISKNLGGKIKFIHFFTKDKKELESIFPKLKKSLAQDGMLWVSWPKTSSKIRTDLNENIIREIGLKNKLVDVKVCAIDEDWSGLKFVYRLKNRK